MNIYQVTTRHNLISILLACLTFSHCFSEPIKIPKQPYGGGGFWSQFKDHPGHSPYISEQSYRVISDHVVDTAEDFFDPSVVGRGDIVYVGIWLLEWFTQNAHPYIRHPYILVTCDVGGWIPSGNYLELLYDPKVAAWYGKNMVLTNHTKCFQLPMGQCYHLWESTFRKNIPTLNELVFNEPVKKDYLVYLNHTIRNHGRRVELVEYFADEPFCTTRNHKDGSRVSVSMPNFWKETAQSKFVFSPLGLEVDCTRTWESFILNAIPVVEHSFLDPLYDDLPILLVYNWDEITQMYLENQYLEIQDKRLSNLKAFMPYWEEKIRAKQNEIRKGKTSFSNIESNNFTKIDLENITSILRQNKMETKPVIYRGNFTFLRPYQLASCLKKIPNIIVVDFWSSNDNQKLLKKYTKDSSLLSDRRICHQDSQQKIDTYGICSCFIDLTHFRHSLIKSSGEFNDYSHSLERDIMEIYKSLKVGSLIFGNMSKDPYVSKALQHLSKNENIDLKYKNSLWYMCKQQ